MSEVSDQIIQDDMYDSASVNDVVLNATAKKLEQARRKLEIRRKIEERIETRSIKDEIDSYYSFKDSDTFMES